MYRKATTWVLIQTTRECHLIGHWVTYMHNLTYIITKVSIYRAFLPLVPIGLPTWEYSIHPMSKTFVLWIPAGAFKDVLMRHSRPGVNVWEPTNSKSRHFCFNQGSYLLTYDCFGTSDPPIHSTAYKRRLTPPQTLIPLAPAPIGTLILLYPLPLISHYYIHLHYL